MIIAMPAALVLEKTIQSLDYLNYINVEDLPRNVRAILDFTSDGSLFGNINPFGNFLKFDDGDEEIDQNNGKSLVKGGGILRRILQA